MWKYKRFIFHSVQRQRETRVLGFNLDEFLGLLVVHQFLRCELIVKKSTAVVYVAKIQVNVSECGGNGIGIFKSSWMVLH